MGLDTACSGEATDEALRFAWPGRNLENMLVPEGAISLVFCVAARPLVAEPLRGNEGGRCGEGWRGRMQEGKRDRWAETGSLSARPGRGARHVQASGYGRVNEKVGGGLLCPTKSGSANSSQADGVASVGRGA